MVAAVYTCVVEIWGIWSSSAAAVFGRPIVILCQMTNEAVLPTNSVVELRAWRNRNTGSAAIAERSEGRVTVRQPAFSEDTAM